MLFFLYLRTKSTQKNCTPSVNQLTLLFLLVGISNFSTSCKNIKSKPGYSGYVQSTINLLYLLTVNTRLLGTLSSIRLPRLLIIMHLPEVVIG